MKYMLLIYSDEAAMQSASKADADQMHAAYGAYMEALKKAGVDRGADRLRRSASATTVRVADGKTKVLDGPYAETKEQLGGYLHDRRARSRRRAVLGRALPRRQPRRDRGASDLGDVRPT